MKWTAEADLVVGLAVGSGKRKLGVGLGIGRRKIIKNIGIDLREHKLKRYCVFFLKNSSVLSLNWSRDTRNSVLLDRDKAMKRSNVFNLLLQMMPASHQPVAPSSPDHWAFLEEVDAPKWADLVKEAALMGTMGDDAWFHRSHLHHETSLAWADNLATVSNSNGASNGASNGIPSGEPQPTKRRRAEKGAGGKGTVSKLIKPALKATVVKACLGGGVKRISNGGSSARRRLSSRPRLSTSLSKSNAVKTVSVIHRSGGQLLQQQKKVVFATSGMAVFDPEKMRRLRLYRQAQSEPSSARATPKKSSDTKSNVNKLRRSEPLLNHVREAAAQRILGSRGATDRRNASRSVGGESDDISLKGFESPASISLYPLPAPIGQGADSSSQADSFTAKSSPSDMYLSSEASPRHSISSQESLVRALSAAATESARRKILSESRRSTKERSNDALEIPSDLSAEIVPVREYEPQSDITPLDADEIVLDDTSATTGGLDWNSREEPHPVVKKRRSLGPPIRVKVAEKVGSSSAKKKSSSRKNQDGGGSAARAPGEKSSGSQATHPILEKLRKSWGSALRVKQRNDAEAALSDTRSDTGAENSAEFKVGGANVTTRKKWDQSQVLSDVMKRAQQAGEAASNQPPSASEALIRNIVTRERRAAIAYQQEQLLKQHPPPPLQLITDDGVLAPPSKCDSECNSDDRRANETYDSTAESKSDAAATGPNAGAEASLARILANHQRSKSDLASKFKKQYVHADTGMSKSMQRSNKENMQLEVKVPSPPTGFAWKRKPAVPTRKQLSPRLVGTAVNTARSVPSQAAARTTTTTTAAHANPHTLPNPPSTAHPNLPAKSLVTSSRSGHLSGSAAQTVSLDAADASSSHSKSDRLERKANHLPGLRGISASSVPKLTKQKSEKISSTTAKEATTRAAGFKTCKKDVKVADESVVIAAEERKSKAGLKYEPRIHGVRAIKEWETKSGKRYYDLSPIERKKVNQEISAATSKSAKRVETKKS